MKTSTRAGTAAPLPRAWLDVIATPVRVLFGVLFISWSWISTVIILGGWLRPLLPAATIPGAPDWFVVAFMVAGLVSLVEFVSSDRWEFVYWLVLLGADASFTAWQTHTWLLIMVSAQTTVGPIGNAAIWLGSIIGGVIAGKFGELLLFGRR